MALVDKIVKLTNQLFPTGRAFKMALESELRLLANGLAVSEAQAITDILSTLDSALPDNDDFETEDATDWERRLGLVSNPLVDLEDRKLAIQRKMNHPGTIKARQHYLYIQGQLRAAGFDVYVYENRFDDGMGGYETQTPAEFSLDPYPTIYIQHGDHQHGDIQHGTTFSNKVVNSLEADVDNNFDLGGDLRNTFFIGGDPAGSWADVDAERETEFRQLILKLKPAQAVAFLLINYV